MPSWFPELLIAVVLVIFQAGGVFYLAKNHFSHVNQKIDWLVKKQIEIGERLSRLEGALRLPPSLTES